MCGGRSRGAAGGKEKEGRLRDTATTHSKKAEGPVVQMRAPWGGSQKVPSPQVPATQNACLHPPSIWQMERD